MDNAVLLMTFNMFWSSFAHKIITKINIFTADLPHLPAILDKERDSGTF